MTVTSRAARASWPCGRRIPNPGRRRSACREDEAGQPGWRLNSMRSTIAVLPSRPLTRWAWTERGNGPSRCSSTISELGSKAVTSLIMVWEIPQRRPRTVMREPSSSRGGPSTNCMLSSGGDTAIRFAGFARKSNTTSTGLLTSIARSKTAICFILPGATGGPIARVDDPSALPYPYYGQGLRCPSFLRWPRSCPRTRFATP